MNCTNGGQTLAELCNMTVDCNATRSCYLAQHVPRFPGIETRPNPTGTGWLLQVLLVLLLKTYENRRCCQKIPYFMNSFRFPPETGQRSLQICCGWHCSGSAFTTQFHVQCPGSFAKFVWPSPADFVAWNWRRFQPPGVDFNEPTKIWLDKNQEKNVRRFSRSVVAVFFLVLWGEIICFAFVEFVCWLRCRPKLFFLTYFDSACLSAMAHPIWRACFSHGWFSHQLD